MLRLFQALAVMLCTAPSYAHAQTTPNHVYQVTEKMVLLLEEINAANFSKPTYELAQTDPALPRHVLQLTREIWRKTQLLRFMNGLPTEALDPVPARIIRPADVKDTADKIYAQIEDLLPAYGIHELPVAPALPTGKTPTDVLANLKRVSVALDSLGIPATVPNDVYQIATTIVQDALRLAEMSSADNAVAAMQSVSIVSGKSPSDAFIAAQDLLEELGALAAIDTFAIKGGVYVPDRKESIKPSDVMSILLRARAEVNAMRVLIKDTEVSANSDYEGGKTPSDVVYAVLMAQAVVQSIKETQEATN